MPHIIVEYTDDLKLGVSGLLTALHNSLASQETIVRGDIKTRAINVGLAIVGDNESASMVHVDLKLMPGRSDELRAKMTGDLRDVVTSNVSDNTSVTVESSDLHAPSYQK